MSKITVIDSVMGSGKSSWAIQHMNSAPKEKRFIYITPFNEELDRIKKECKERQFRSTNLDNYDGRKMCVVKDWLQERVGPDICSTHSLFRQADGEFIEYLKQHKYTLILDEAMDVIAPVDICKEDIEMLLTEGHIELCQDGRVAWLNDEYRGRFTDIKAYALAGTLFHGDDSLFVWSFPPEVFSAFEKVYCMTYLFKAQTQRCYFELHSMDYDMKTMRRDYDGSYHLVEYDVRGEGRAELISLIDLYDGPLNDIGKDKFALSTTWFKNPRKSEDKKALQRASRNYLVNIQKAKVGEALWATKKGKEKGKGYFKLHGYDSAYAPVNERATNKWANRWALVYAFNRFDNPNGKQFFYKHGITVNEDALAVSDLLQWIWRSRIRNGQPIKLYLPSSRMRALLLAWSRYEI